MSTRDPLNQDKKKETQPLVFRKKNRIASYTYQQGETRLRLEGVELLRLFQDVIDDYRDSAKTYLKNPQGQFILDANNKFKWAGRPSLGSTEERYSPQRVSEITSFNDWFNISVKDKPHVIINIPGYGPLKVELSSNTLTLPSVVTDVYGNNVIIDKPGKAANYAEITIQLTRMARNRDPENVAPEENNKPYNDHLIARDILSIMRGEPPRYYTGKADALLFAEVAVLLFGVEVMPSRDDKYTQFFSSLLMLDMVAKKQTYSSDQRRYLICNVFDTAKQHEGKWYYKRTLDPPPSNQFLAQSVTYQLITEDQHFSNPTSDNIGGKAPPTSSSYYGKSVGMYAKKNLLIRDHPLDLINPISPQKLARANDSVINHRIMIRIIKAYDYWLKHNFVPTSPINTRQELIESLKASFHQFIKSQHPYLTDAELLQIDVDAIVRQQLQKTVSGTPLPSISFASQQAVPLPSTSTSNPVTTEVRKGITISSEQMQSMGLPSEFKIAKAYGRADCFFDSFAQGLNAILGKEEFTMKSLRELCDKYVKSLNPKDNWVKTLIEKDHQQNFQCTYEEYLTTIRYTAAEMDQLKSEGFFNGLAIWGRSHIDGLIICKAIKEQYGRDINLHVVELIDEEGIKATSHQLITADGGKSVEASDIHYDDGKTLHMAVHKAHFVAVLPTQAYEKIYSVEQSHIPDFGEDRSLQSTLFDPHEEDINEQMIKIAIKEEAFHLAEKNDIERLVKLISENPFVLHMTDSEKGSLLHYAVQSRDVGFANWLLEQKIPITAQDKFGNTALHYATANNDLKMISILLDHGARIDITNNDHLTPLQMVNTEDTDRFIQDIISRQSKVDEMDVEPKKVTTLDITSYSKEEERQLEEIMARIERQEYAINLAKQGRFVQLNELISQDISLAHISDSHRGNLLHYAAQFGDVVFASKLLEVGVPFAVKDIKGNTPLHYAVENGDLKLVDLLLRQGASLKAINNDGQFPKNMTTNPEIIQFLQYHEREHSEQHHPDLKRTDMMSQPTSPHKDKKTKLKQDEDNTIENRILSLQKEIELLNEKLPTAEKESDKLMQLIHEKQQALLQLQKIQMSMDTPHTESTSPFLSGFNTKKAHSKDWRQVGGGVKTSDAPLTPTMETPVIPIVTTPVRQGTPDISTQTNLGVRKTEEQQPKSNPSFVFRK